MASGGGCNPSRGGISQLASIMPHAHADGDSLPGGQRLRLDVDEEGGHVDPCVFATRAF